MIWFHIMKGKVIGYLKVLEFSHWKNSSTFWECQCICGRIVKVDRRRLSGENSKKYKSCGCLRDVNSKTYFLDCRKRFFYNIKKDGNHWIFQSNSKQTKIMVRAFNKYYTCQRLAYMFWHHIKEMPRDLEVDAICNERGCVKPSHLRVLTPSERNTLRFKNKPSPLKGKTWKWKKNEPNERLRNIQENDR